MPDVYKKLITVCEKYYVLVLHTVKDEYQYKGKVVNLSSIYCYATELVNNDVQIPKNIR